MEIVTKDRGVSFSTTVVNMLNKVCTEMERRGLCYAKTLEPYKERGMPWLEKCMVRSSPAMGCNHAHFLTTLTFLSAVGLLENNTFVKYKTLDTLLRDPACYSKEAPGAAASV